MEILKENRENRQIVSLKGRLDAVSGPELEAVLQQVFEERTKDDWKELEICCRDMDYISSAGLRVLLAARRAADGYGCKLMMTKVNKFVMNILQMTGFTQILDIRGGEI